MLLTLADLLRLLTVARSPIGQNHLDFRLPLGWRKTKIGSSF
jgi:hypothetical protein